ncbi:hypothetical protein ACDQ55_02940 [Chitinophaga sp. 30R24]|uniref:hypothetical protein n=1 Tax=Chitinophaga sp. 30R24 TaxID=3248838 RepID=UPI003B8F7A6E
MIVPISNAYESVKKKKIDPISNKRLPVINARELINKSVDTSISFFDNLVPEEMRARYNLIMRIVELINKEVFSKTIGERRFPPSLKTE